MNDAVIVSAVRTAAGKAPSGTLRGTRPDELAAVAIGEALRRAPGIEPAEIDDVILGCAMPMSAATRESSAPTVIATHEPNDMPAAHSGASGYVSCMTSSAARKSSISPGPFVKVPALAPALRKLNRSTAQPIRLSALAAW